jgi:hypothetical protein
MSRMNPPTTSSTAVRSDVCIVGNGVIAKTAALGLAQAGHSVTLLAPAAGPAAPDAASWDVRVYALNQTAHTLLSALKVWGALDMARVGVRSNCVAPFAWSRMTSSVPAETPEQKLRVERFKTMGAEKIAPLVAFLASDRAKEVNNQIFAVRRNEIVLFNKPRPVRSMTKIEGWTAETIADELIPAFRPSFARADEVSAHVFPYDPI